MATWIIKSQYEWQYSGIMWINARFHPLCLLYVNIKSWLAQDNSWWHYFSSWVPLNHCRKRGCSKMTSASWTSKVQKLGEKTWWKYVISVCFMYWFEGNLSLLISPHRSFFRSSLVFVCCHFLSLQWMIHDLFTKSHFVFNNTPTSPHKRNNAIFWLFLFFKFLGFPLMFLFAQVEHEH